MTEEIRLAIPGQPEFPIHALLERTIDALAGLDAEAIEILIGQCPLAAAPASAEEWRRAARGRRVLAHLLGATAGRIDMLHRVAKPELQFQGYSTARPPAPPGDAKVARRLHGHRPLPR